MLLYKDDLVIKAGYIKELLVKLYAWKYWKEKGLHVNIKYEVMLSGPLSLSAQNACVTNYLMMEDGRDTA